MAAGTKARAKKPKRNMFGMKTPPGWHFSKRDGNPFFGCLNCGAKHFQSVCPKKCDACSPPDPMSTTTPAGIATHDPDATPLVSVDPEFRALCPELTEEERTQLTINILRDGCRDPLTVWDETGILVDGHNRKEICEANDVAFNVTRRSFPDREAAKDWVITNQLGRRNLTPHQADYLRGKKLEAAKASRGGDRKSKRQVDALNGKAATRIAKETGVSPRTVERNEVFSRAVDRLDNVGVPRNELLKGKKKMSQAAAKTVATMAPKEVHSVARKLRNGSAESVDEAIGFRIQMPAKAKEPSPTRKADPLGLPQEFASTLLNRLDELEKMFVGRHASAVRLVKDIKTFVKGWC